MRVSSKVLDEIRRKWFRVFIQMMSEKKKNVMIQSKLSDQFTLNKIWKNSIICVSRWSIYGEKLRVERDF